MQLSNSTINQHFLSRAEQQLNALNPRAQSSHRRIYSFSLKDREAHQIELDDVRGRSISTNLALRDLFSFSVIEGEQDRLNLEALFGQYEVGIKTNTDELLRKLRSGDSDIKKELIELFVAKFMNFLRNPYSIHKVLNTIGGLLAYEPTDPILLAHYQAVLEGKKPHQEYLSQQLGIDSPTYKRWLAVLFMALFRPAPDVPNLMEGIVKGIFENPNSSPQAAILQYVDKHADKRCLLSDRGHISVLPDAQGLSFSFNLNSTAFINYTFFNTDQFATDKVLPHVIEFYKTQPKNMQVQFITNNLDALISYNRNVVYQCAQHVYCSSTAVFGVM